MTEKTDALISRRAVLEMCWGREVGWYSMEVARFWTWMLFLCGVPFLPNWGPF